MAVNGPTHEEIIKQKVSEYFVKKVECDRAQAEREAAQSKESNLRNEVLRRETELKGFCGDNIPERYVVLADGVVKISRDGVRVLPQVIR